MRLPTSALLITAALAAGAYGARECFNSDGTPGPASAQNLSAAEAWQPCSGNSGGVTSCCSPSGYCMSNGLCINSGNDNMMSQQGCTSRTWEGEMCRNYCKGRTGNAAGVHFLWRCNDGVYCCADNRTNSCCEGPSSEKFVIEVGSIIGRPGPASPLEFGDIVPLDVPAQGPASGIPPSSSPTNSLDPAGAVGTPQDTTDGDRNHSQTLAIGVGVGLPLILAILSVLLWCRLRTRSGLPRRHASSTDKSAKGNNGPHYLHDFNGQNQHSYGRDFKAAAGASSLAAVAVVVEAVELGNPSAVELDCPGEIHHQWGDSPTLGPSSYAQRPRS